MLRRVWTTEVAGGNLIERIPYSVHLFLVAIHPKFLKILGCITWASSDKTGSCERFPRKTQELLHFAWRQSSPWCFGHGASQLQEYHMMPGRCQYLKVDEPSRPESSCRRQTGGPLVCGGARAAENRGEDERAQAYLEDGRSRARCHYISAFLFDYIVIVLCEIQ